MTCANSGDPPDVQKKGEAGAVPFLALPYRLIISLLISISRETVTFCSGSCVVEALDGVLLAALSTTLGLSVFST